MLSVIVLLVAGALFVGLGTFLGKLGVQRYLELRKLKKEEAALEKAKSTMMPNIKINLFPEHVFTEHKLPLKLYTLEIQNTNKDSAEVFDFRIEFAFEHNLVETKQNVLIPIGNVSVGGVQTATIKEGKRISSYEGQPRETPESKYFSLNIEKAKINEKVIHTNFVVFNCEKWPKGAFYIGKIMVDLSTKLPSIVKKPYLIGKYEGQYSFEIMGRKFSNKVGGEIPSPTEKKL